MANVTIQDVQAALRDAEEENTRLRAIVAAARSLAFWSSGCDVNGCGASTPCLGCQTQRHNALAKFEAAAKL